jgi:hypothetical protein
MKVHDEALEERRAAEAQRVAWLLELAQDDWAWRGGTLAATLDGAAYPARLGELKRWREWLPTTGTEGGRARADAVLRVASAANSGGSEDDGSLRDALQERAPSGILATLRLAWLDPEAPESDAATAAVMLRGRLTAWSQDATGVTLTLMDELEALGQRRIGRLLRSGMLAGLDSSAIGQTLPWIFGSLRDAELIPLRVGATTKLSAALTATATVIPVVSLAGFGTSGTAQIGAELIEYTAVDATVLTLGTASAPVTRGASSTTAAAHSKGTVVRCLPSDGLLWLAADHPCLAVNSVMADLDVLNSGLWTAESITLGGVTAQGILMTTWPLNSDGDLASRVSASVEGLADAGGTLIANPARVIEALLTGARMAALDADRIDATALATVAAGLTARGYLYVRRLNGDETLGDLLDEAAQEAGLWIQATDPIRLAVATPTPYDADMAQALDATWQLVPAAAATIAAPTGYLPPDAVELIGAAPTSASAKPTWTFPLERQADGTCPKTYAMQWLDMSGATTAATSLGEMLWRRQCDAPFVEEQLYAIGAALASAGDVVRRAWALTGLPSAACWARLIQAGSATGGAARARIETWGPWALGYCWQQDDDNYIRRYASGSYVQLVIAGRPVALLTREGTLRLTGQLTETPGLGLSAQAAPIVLAAGALVLACGDSKGGFAPFLKIDAQGNATLAGALREKSRPPIAAGGQSYDASPGSFWMAPGLREVALAWDATARVLHLPEILIERAAL